MSAAGDNGLSQPHWSGLGAGAAAHPHDLQAPRDPRPPTAPSDPASPAEHPAWSAGDRYEPHALLGVGGMGRVWLARDRKLDRWVALKEVRAGGPAVATMRARLQHEAALTARLDHPGIVPIYDVDARADGTLYYTMRVVRGRSLAATLATRGEADLGHLVRNLEAACEAVGFAHRMGVVHRDLKPDNIMIGEFGETQVVDWGLAAELAGAPRGAVGTPRYMAPEQAAGQVVDARADVFSLGRVAAELLPERGARGPREAHELRAIVARATAADPAARYGDAKALADDLSRWLEGRRVTAYDYGPRQILARFVRAWRVPLTVASVALALLVAVAVVAFVRTEAARDRAVGAEVEARAALAEARANLAALLTNEAARRHREGARPEAEVLAAHAFALAPSPEARALLMSNDGPRPVPERTWAMPPDCTDPTILPGGEALLCRTASAISAWDVAPLAPRFVLRLASQARPVALDGGRFAVAGATAIEVFDDHGRSLGKTPRLEATPGVAADADGHAAFWSTTSAWLVGRKDPSQAAVDTFERCRDHPPLTVAPGARPLALCADGLLVAPADPATAPIATGIADAAALVRAGDEVIIATHDGRVIAWGDHVRFERASGLRPIRELLVAPDGRTLVVRGERAGLALLDRATGAWLGRLPLAASRAARFVDAHTLVTAGDALVRWHLPPPSPRAFEADGGVTAIDVRGPGADPIIAWAADRTLETGTRRARTRVVIDDAITIKGLALGPDGDELVAVASGFDGLATLAGDRRAAFARARRVARLEGPRGAAPWFVALDYGGRVVAVPAGSDEGALVVGADGALGDHHDLAVAPGHRYAAVASATEGRVRRLAWAPDAIRADRDAALADVLAIALERDGEHLWVAFADHLARYAFVDPEGVVEVGAIATPGQDWVELALSDLGPEGTWIAAGDRLGGVALWRARGDDATLVARFADHDARVAALAFAPDGSFLATGAWDRRVFLRTLSEPRAPADYERAWGLTLERALDRAGPTLPPSRFLPAPDRD